MLSSKREKKFIRAVVNKRIELQICQSENEIMSKR